MPRRRIPFPALTACLLLLAPALAGLLAAAPGGNARPAAAPTARASAADSARSAGRFTDLGPQIRGLTLMHGVVGRAADGRPVLYTVLVGRPARLVAVDPRTRRVVAEQPLPGADGAWTLVVASDGTVYAGTYPRGRLYRYSPAADHVADLGRPVAGQTFLYGLSAGPDGEVFGGTFPGGRLFRYRPDLGAQDLGRPAPGERYVLATAYDAAQDAVLAGVGQHARLVRVDLATGRRHDLLPARYAGQAAVAGLALIRGRLFAQLRPAGRTVVLDPRTGAPEPLTDASRRPPLPAASFPCDARELPPPAPGGRTVYYTSRGRLYGFDLATDTFRPVRAAGAPARTGGPAVAAGWFPAPSPGGRAALYALIGNYSGLAMRFVPTSASTGRPVLFHLPLPRRPVALYNLTAGPDGRVYSSGFINGDLAVYDPARRSTVQYHRLGQVEGWAWRKGLMYAGTYPRAEVYVYDPRRPFAPGANPRRLFRLAGQSRPVALAFAAGRLFTGTVPGHGRYGGVLAEYDPGTRRLRVHRRVAPGQSVSALAAQHGSLWVGTSTSGGAGTSPETRQASLIQWDPRSGRVVRRLVPVPGAQSLLALAAGPDGLLWGLADGTLFAYDARRGAVVRRIAVAPHARPSVVDGDLAVGRRGLYGTVAGVFFRVDPRRGRAVVLRRGAYRAVLAPGGAVYLLTGGLSSSPDLWRYRPARRHRPVRARPAVHR